jgi:hypothetical protein
MRPGDPGERKDPDRTDVPAMRRVGGESYDSRVPDRPDARRLEVKAAARSAPLQRGRAPACEPLAMLVRRGLHPRTSRPDLPFDPGLPEEALDGISARLGHYAFRLFLRGAILAPAGFLPAEASRYLDPDQALAMAEDCVAMGLAEPRPGGRYRLVTRARSFGGTLEWWVAREIRSRLGFDVAMSVRSGARGVGGDLDLVAAAEGKLLYAELKSGPPKHLTDAEVEAFLLRLRIVRPDLSLFVVDTALRLADKVLPMFVEALARGRATLVSPRRLFRDTWALTPHLYLVSAKEDLIDNACRAIAEGLRELSPPGP